MRMFCTAFLYGLSAGLVALLLQGPEIPVAREEINGTTNFLLAFAIGLIFGTRRREGEGMHTGFSVLPPIFFALFSLICLAALRLLPVLWPGVTVIGSMLSGLLAAHMIRSLGVFVAAQQVQRLHLWSAVIMGGCLSYPVFLLERTSWIFSGPFVLAVVLVLLIRLNLSLKTRDQLTCTYRAESLLTGWGTSLGVILLGLGWGGMFHFVRGVLGSASHPLPPAPGLWLAALVSLALGALLPAILQPRLRRSGIQMGAAALLAVGTLGGTLRVLATESGLGWADAVVERLQLDASNPEITATVVSLVLLGPLCLLLGAGMTTLVRLYASVPPGGKILRTTPPEQRLAPDGGLSRTGLLLIGVFLGWVLVESAPELPLRLLTVGGVLLILLDPRGGLGRKGLVLAVTLAAALVGLLPL